MSSNSRHIASLLCFGQKNEMRAFKEFVDDNSDELPKSENELEVSEIKTGSEIDALLMSFVGMFGSPVLSEHFKELIKEFEKITFIGTSELEDEACSVQHCFFAAQNGEIIAEGSGPAIAYDVPEDEDEEEDYYADFHRACEELAPKFAENFTIFLAENDIPEKMNLFSEEILYDCLIDICQENGDGAAYLEEYWAKNYKPVREA